MAILGGGHEHDVFVSYAHVDDLPLGTEDVEWVASFVPCLRKTLTAKLDRPADVWQDGRLDGNAALGPGLFSRVKASATFLAIVSPPYVRSDWCRRELQAFVDHNRRTEGFEGRILRASKYPVDEDRIARELILAPTYQFYKYHPAAQIAVEWLPSQATFRNRVNQLATNIAKVISTLEIQNRVTVQG